MMVRAKAAGEVGPAAEDEVTTPPEGMEDSYGCDFFFSSFSVFFLGQQQCFHNFVC